MGEKKKIVKEDLKAHSTFFASAKNAAEQLFVPLTLLFHGL